MLKLRTFAVALFLVAGLAPLASAQSQRPSPGTGQAVGGKPHEKTIGDKQKAYPDQRGTEQAPFVVKMLPAPKAKDEAANGAAKQPEKTATGWSLSDTIAGIAAAAGLIQAVALFMTIGVLVGTARRQLRAYVLPESGGLIDGTMLNPPQPQHGGEPGVALLFKNSGQTPAFRYVSWAQIAVIEPTQAHTLVPPPIQPVFPATVGAGGTVSKALWFGRPLTQEEIADVLHGRKLIFVYGRIEYLDAFRRRRWATFRLQYFGVFPPPPASF